MKTCFWTVVFLSILGSVSWAASKNRPSEANESMIFEKVSPHMKVEAQIETLESRYGRRVVLSLTAQKTYHNLNYKVQFHPEIELLSDTPLEGEASLTESESLILTYIFDVRDVSEVVALQITAYEEMPDRKRHGISEMIEVYRPASTMKSGEEEYKFPPEKTKRVFQ